MLSKCLIYELKQCSLACPFLQKAFIGGCSKLVDGTKVNVGREKNIRQKAVMKFKSRVKYTLVLRLSYKSCVL